MKSLIVLAFVFLVYELEVARSKQFYFLPLCNNSEIINVDLSDSGSNSGGVISFLDGASKGKGYPTGLNCTVSFTPPENHVVFLTFKQINIRNCSYDNVTVTTDDGSTTSVPLCAELQCPEENCNGTSFFSNKNSSILISFFSSSEGNVSTNLTGFQATVTALRHADVTTGACVGIHERFKCDNSFCMWEGFVCDTNNNCGDRSDEKPGCSSPRTTMAPILPTPPVTTKQVVWGVIVIVLGILMMVTLLPFMCYLAFCGTQRTIQTTTSHWNASSQNSLNDNERLLMSLASNNTNYGSDGPFSVQQVPGSYYSVNDSASERFASHSHEEVPNKPDNSHIKKGRSFSKA